MTATMTATRNKRISKIAYEVPIHTTYTTSDADSYYADHHDEFTQDWTSRACAPTSTYPMYSLNNNMIPIQNPSNYSVLDHNGHFLFNAVQCWVDYCDETLDHIREFAIYPMFDTDDITELLISQCSEALIIIINYNKMINIHHKLQSQDGILNSYLATLLSELMKTTRKVSSENQ